MIHARSPAERTVSLLPVDHDQYCEKIEVEVNTRQGDGIIWGSAEAVRHDVERISGRPILFEQHYHDRCLCLNRS